MISIELKCIQVALGFGGKRTGTCFIHYAYLLFVVNKPTV